MRVRATSTLHQSTSGSTCSMLVHDEFGSGRSPHAGRTKSEGRDKPDVRGRFVSSRRPMMLGCAVILAISMLTCTGPRVQAGASSTAGPSWLAAGDSYASGQGLPNPVGKCARGTGSKGSGSTWAIVAAKVLRSSGANIGSVAPSLVACTGAISDQLFHADGSKTGAEWTPSMGRFNVVSFSFGGDDIGFASILKHCLSFGCPSDADVRKKISKLATGGLIADGVNLPSYVQFLEHVANKVTVPDGNVIVMGYPELIEDPNKWNALLGYCQSPRLTASEARLIRGWSGDLNATIGEAVAQIDKLPSFQRDGVKFTFVDAVSGSSSNNIPASDPNLFEPSTGNRHELCSQGDQNWLTGIVPSHPVTHSFHPTQDGETAMGDLAAEVMLPLAKKTVPVRKCPTQNSNPYPRPVPDWLTSGSTIPDGNSWSGYEDSEGYVALVGPSRWRCQASIAQDGGETLVATPPGATRPVNSEVSSGVSVVYSPSCTGCIYDLVCSVIPSASLPDFYETSYGPCFTAPPSRETDTLLTPDVVKFEDPAGVVGTGTSDGSNPAVGLVMFVPGGGDVNDTAFEITCSLPQDQMAACKSVIADFETRYSAP